MCLWFVQKEWFLRVILLGIWLHWPCSMFVDLLKISSSYESFSRESDFTGDATCLWFTKELARNTHFHRNLTSLVILHVCDLLKWTESIIKSEIGFQRLCCVFSAYKMKQRTHACYFKNAKEYVCVCVWEPVTETNPIEIGSVPHPPNPTLNNYSKFLLFLIDSNTFKMRKLRHFCLEERLRSKNKDPCNPTSAI